MSGWGSWGFRPFGFAPSRAGRRARPPCFLGCLFSMILGPAPIVFPAVLGLAVPYGARFYVHLAALHASLALRIAGDLAAWSSGRQWGALLNALAVVLFVVNTAYGVLAARRAPRKDS